MHLRQLSQKRELGHEIAHRLGRCPNLHVTVRHILHDPGLAFDNSVLSDGHVILNTYVTGNDGSIADYHRAGDSGMSHHNDLFSQPGVMSHHDLIIYFAALTDNGSAHGGTVDGSVRADFRIILNNYG